MTSANVHTLSSLIVEAQKHAVPAFGLFLLLALHVCRAREALRQCLPDQLRDATFANCLQDDKSTKHWLSQLLKNLETGPVTVGDPRSVGISPLAPQ
jgi:hypothetical protein